MTTLYDITDYSLDQLYDYYERTIAQAESLKDQAHPRTLFHVESALRDFRKFG